MNTKPHLIAAARLWCVAVLSFSVPAFAIETEDAEPIELDDVIVTAALEPIAARDVNASITVITREQIELLQARHLTDVLRTVPGFAVSQSGGPGSQTQIRVRGAEGNHLLVLMDGIRANDPASGGEFSYQYQSTANIERIEIIRGPQSAIWGTDALAGVINIIRRRDTQDQYANGALEYGSFNSLSASATGGLNRGSLLLNGGISYDNTDGTNISRSGTEEDGAENTNANLNLEISPSDAWKLRLSGQHVSATTEFDDFDFLTDGLPIDANRVTEAKRNYVRAEAAFKPVASRWSGTASANWMDTENDNFANGSWDGSTSAQTFEARVRGSVTMGSEQNHRLTVALDREDVDFSQRGIALPWGDPNQDQDYTRSGYAAEIVSNPFSGFTWTANARQDDFSDFDDAFTWQLAASQRFKSGFRLRGSVGTGSKAPTFTERYGFYSGTFLGNPDLQPESSRGWELGAEQDLAEGRLMVGAVYFDQQLEDEIDGFVFDPETFLFTARNKQGKSKRRGVELLANGQLSGNFDFGFSYTWTDATESDATGNKITEIRRPEHMANLNLNYRFGSDRGLLNLNINYNGSQFDAYFPPPYFIAETVKLDSFTVANLAFAWKVTDGMELTARVSNLFDEDYEEILGFARPGRAVYAGLRGTWGN